MSQPAIKILVVDDVQTIRMHVKEILRSTGYSFVKTASNGVEALKMLNEERFQLVISDWHMHPMDGLTLLKEVRAQAGLQPIAFIMLTADSTKEHVIQAISSGVDDYVTKPFTVEHAQIKIPKALIRRKLL